MAFPPGAIATDKTPGPPSSATEHPNHHNDLAAAINDTVAELVDHLLDGVAHGSNGGYTYTTDETDPPVTPSVGETWFAPDTGTTYLRFDDGVSVGWLQASTSGSSAPVVIDGGEP